MIICACCDAQCRQVLRDRRGLRLGLREVERSRDAVGEAVAHQGDALLRQRQIVADERLFALELAQLHIILRELGDRRQRDATPRLDRGLGLRAGGLDRAADAAEQVELPAGADHRLEQVERERRARRRRDQRGRAVEALALAGIFGGRIDMRQALRRGDVALRARLRDALGGALQVEILLGQPVDQRAQLGIAEIDPPGRIDFAAIGAARHVGGFGAVRADGESIFGPLEVRADSTAREQQQGSAVLEHPPRGGRRHCGATTWPGAARRRPAATSSRCVSTIVSTDMPIRSSRASG